MSIFVPTSNKAFGPPPQLPRENSKVKIIMEGSAEEIAAFIAELQRQHKTNI